MYEMEVGGWNIPETVRVEPEPVEERDFTGFEL